MISDKLIYCLALWRVDRFIAHSLTSLVYAARSAVHCLDQSPGHLAPGDALSRLGIDRLPVHADQPADRSQITRRQDGDHVIS